MMRDEIWTICSNDYASKPRPAIIIQDDDAADIDSAILYLLTMFNLAEIQRASRVTILPIRKNGLLKISYAVAGED